VSELWGNVDEETRLNCEKIMPTTSAKDINIKGKGMSLWRSMAGKHVQKTTYTKQPKKRTGIKHHTT
jgi:hypothetical protein